MFSTRHLNAFLRAAGLSLVLVAMVSGQLSLGSPCASTDDKPCGASCPCDGEQHAEVTQTGSHDDCAHGEPAGPGDEGPCDDDCPECSCCTGLVVALEPAAAIEIARARSSTRRAAALDRAASGDRSGVFRPPRRLS